MEVIYYRCPACGFTYQVPAYWSDYAPDKEMALEHVDLKTGAMCETEVLQLVEEQR